MVKRTDIESILILGAGPIIIGQACEFDYSGAQACKALVTEGYRVILINSNPATIMTDPDIADVTYIEPIIWEVVLKIIEKERPDALLPTMGGQTALNCALDLEHKGILQEFGVEMIGATYDSILKAENRECFRDSMHHIGLKIPCSGIAHNMKEADLVLSTVGFPCIVRPSFTMGGTGGGIAYNFEDYKEICKRGFNLSPVKEILIDESLIGWKEYEMELIRDKKDNCIVVCSIENFDPMGIHTGDSITVAPAQTLTDKEYQMMRNSSILVLREIGIEGGSANVQFAMHPNNGELTVIEMNPRVSRSSALASKATGFPIAKIAAQLSIGYTLDELANDLTGGCIPASFEPSIDYIVTKIPRFSFEKFAGFDDHLNTQMQSVGEVMAIGRTQQESLQKALRGLEIGVVGFDSKMNYYDTISFVDVINNKLKIAGSDRIFYIADAFRIGFSVDMVFKITNIDRWFLVQIQELVILEKDVINFGLFFLKDKKNLYNLKCKGFSDAYLAKLVDVSEKYIRNLRNLYDIHPVYKKVDTCAAEFPTDTSYMYSTYESECEGYYNKDYESIMILGGGPNRIGQGIEFDYCCVHASLALREDGYEIIMVNCNPETVSTDYDVSNKLYFEPVTIEDILEIVRLEHPKGVIVQYGGQTPLKLAKLLEEEGVPLIGTNTDDIDCAEDRKRFQKKVKELGLKQPVNVTVTSLEVARKEAKIIGYPIVVRPSYVLGGRAMEIVHNDKNLIRYFHDAVAVSHNSPILLDSFLVDAIEVDVDAICDGKDVFIGGVMEHVEQAGIHSGDSACSLPAYTLTKNLQDNIRGQVYKLAFAFKVYGLMNVQFAIKDGEIYLLEVNLRASRTVPFVSKAIGVPLAKIAARVMVGKSLVDQGIIHEVIPPYFSVKEAVLPFNKFPGYDPVLGPEMRSTGEVMGIGDTFAEAYAKAMLGISLSIKKSGYILLSIFDEDDRIIDLWYKLIKNGFLLDVTESTGLILKKLGISSCIINNICKDSKYIHNKIAKGGYVYIIDIVMSGDIHLENSKLIRLAAVQYKVPYLTTFNSSFAMVKSSNIDATEQVISLQERHSAIVN